MTPQITITRVSNGYIVEAEYPDATQTTSVVLSHTDLLEAVTAWTNTHRKAEIVSALRSK